MEYLFAIIGFFVTIVSWYICAWLTRKNEIDKIRTEARIVCLRKAIDCLQVWKKIVSGGHYDEDYARKMAEDVTVELQLIGSKLEVQNWLHFCEMNQKQQSEHIKSQYERLISCLIESYKKEMRIK